MGITDEVKVESSLPVMSRVSILDLANLDKFWWESQGVHIRTMSQLVSWSLSGLLEKIEENGLLEGRINTVEEANRHLEDRGLYQRSMVKRSRKKLSTALAFESLRREGVDPRMHVPNQYSMVHKGRDERGTGPVSKAELDRLVKIYKGEEEVKMLSQEEANRKYYAEQREKKREEEIDKLLEKGGGIREGMSEEELKKYDEEREREVLERENVDVDEEFVKSQIVDN